MANPTDTHPIQGAEDPRDGSQSIQPARRTEVPAYPSPATPPQSGARNERTPRSPTPHSHRVAFHTPSPTRYPYLPSREYSDDDPYRGRTPRSPPPRYPSRPRRSPSPARRSTPMSPPPYDGRRHPAPQYGTRRSSSPYHSESDVDYSHRQWQRERGPPRSPTSLPTRYQANPGEYRREARRSSPPRYQPSARYNPSYETDRSTSRSRPISSPGPVECFYCKKRGHYKRDCRK